MKLALLVLWVCSIGAQSTKCKEKVGPNSKCTNDEWQELGKTREQCIEDCTCDPQCRIATYQESEEKCIFYTACANYQSDQIGYDTYDFGQCTASDRASCPADGDNADGNNDDEDAADGVDTCTEIGKMQLWKNRIFVDSIPVNSGEPWILTDTLEECAQKCLEQNACKMLAYWVVSSETNIDNHNYPTKCWLLADSAQSTPNKIVSDENEMYFGVRCEMVHPQIPDANTPPNKIIQADDGNVVGGEGTPCPSDCWNWNASEQKCTINEDAGCFSLICEHDSIMVNFASKLYGISDEDESDVLDGPEANFDAGDSQWKINCNLGECDMIAETEEKDGKNHLTFSFDVGKKMKKVEMSESDVFIHPVAAELTFKCMYLAEVQLTSNEFSIKGAAATGESVKTGFLDDGFNLAIYTDETYETVANGENVFVGYPVFGKVEWSVTTAQTAVNFYILTCNVQSESAQIAVVRNTCYSTTLGARQLQEDKLVATSSAFTFTAFTIGAYEMDTTVACTVRLCLVSDSDCAASLVDVDASCPDDEAYGYKAVTFQ